jgi:chemotaxis protein methyltransferase CheR
VTHFEFGYDTAQFEKLRQLAKQFAGIEIDESKIDMVYSRMIRIIRSGNLTDFSGYISSLQQGNPETRKEFINAITTNLTSFFREKHHFDLLVNTALPDVMQQKRADKTIKVWSAGCSTGEEPYTIAFTLSQFFSTKPGWNYEIYASDIDSNVLNKARSGVYNLSSIEAIPSSEIARCFYKGTGGNAGLCKVKPEFKEKINFFECNLIEPIELNAVFDIIFCRNVLIYFDSANQTQILDKLMSHLVPNGYIFTGHSESFMYHYKKTKLISKTMYRKIV